MTMVWNVYNYGINHREIKTYNVFKHHSFNQDIQRLLKENLFYDEFSKRLHRIVMYYFWCKAQHEIVITSWVPYIDNKELDRLNVEREERRTYRYNVNLDVNEKVDVCDQLELNWEQFAKYVYSFKKR